MSAHPALASSGNRIGMLDTMRGIAVLGILLMNITGFGLPYSYDDPTVVGQRVGCRFSRMAGHGAVLRRHDARLVHAPVRCQRFVVPAASYQRTPTSCGRPICIFGARRG